MKKITLNVDYLFVYYKTVFNSIKLKAGILISFFEIQMLLLQPLIT
jgi:hypothetical protein